MQVVPELLCSDLERSVAFFIEVLEFEVLYRREEETFACLGRETTRLMLEQVDGPGRRWVTGPLEQPFGRGINFEWPVSDATRFHGRVVSRRPDCIHVPLEHRAYRVAEGQVSQSQFVVQDPDGYLFRFCSGG